jgi:hypothetical protein
MKVALACMMLAGVSSTTLMASPAAKTVTAVSHNVPDVAGMTLKGVVSCGSTPLKGVVVSDGVNVTTTDASGRYYLPSDKSVGYVFVSLPQGYTVATDGNTPQFYSFLTGDATVVEQHDFELVKEDAKSDYVFLVMSDMHFCGEYKDTVQYRERFLSDINPLIAEYKAKGKKVYGITLGDTSWDRYWEKTGMTPAEAKKQVAKIDCSIFNCMGNHDNDPYVSHDDLKAAGRFQQALGPAYYSFNLGKIHYVVLDDVYYINDGGTPTEMGKKNYRAEIPAYQMEWLKRDLATLKDKSTPLVVCTHIPLHSQPTVTKGVQVDKLSKTHYNSGVVDIDPDSVATISLPEVLASFKDVRLFTGHNHLNFTSRTGNITEYNVASVCAGLWWTGQKKVANNHVCRDGAPGGYRVLEVNGSKIKDYYKSMGYSKDYQFRTYDLNNILITADKYCPKYPDDDISEYVGVYAKPAEKKNQVLINVWGYGPGWSITVEEGDKELKVRQVKASDPLYIISYITTKYNKGSRSKSNGAAKSAHMFRVTASSATSTLKITVTDPFGNEYTEKMVRPKAFSTSMK